MRRIAFVVQRCGEQVVGGAEALALAIAEQLTREPDIEPTILTTTAQDYQTWQNVYRPGHERIRGVHVIRFLVDAPRNLRRFDELSRSIRFRMDRSSTAEQERWLHEQGPNSTELIDYVTRFGDLYDVFVFFGYLYATTYFVLPLVEGRAILAPLAHDEWPIRLPVWDDFFHRPSGFVFNTPEERSFTRSRFPEHGIDGPIAGVGINADPDASPERFRIRFGILEPFLLYLGRIEPAKGCDELLAGFLRLRARSTVPLKLVLAGDVKMAIPPHPDIISLGIIDQQAKWDALAACEALTMLSPFESLSIAVLEAWASSKPVIVSSRSPVVVAQCRRSQGGVWVANDDEFAAAVELLDQGTRDRLGAQGAAYVRANYDWTRVIATYRRTFENLARPGYFGKSASRG